MIDPAMRILDNGPKHSQKMRGHLLHAPMVKEIATVEPIKIEYAPSLHCMHFKVDANAWLIRSQRFHCQILELPHGRRGVLQSKYHLEDGRRIQPPFRSEFFHLPPPRDVLLV